MNAYDTQALVMASKQYKNPQMWLYNFLIAGNEKPQKTRKFEIQTMSGRRLKTPLVGNLENGKLIEKQSFNSQYITPPMIKPYVIAEAEDSLKQNFGQDLYGNTYQDLVEDKVAEETSEVMDIALRTKQWMLATLLTTGIHPMHKGAIGISYGDFNTEVLTGTDKWSDPSSDIYGYLKESQQEILKATGKRPDTLIVESSVGTAIQNNTKINEIVSRPTNAMLVQMKPEYIQEGATFIGYIPEFNMTIYSFTDWVSDDGITDIELLPVGSAIMCSKASFETKYAAFKWRAEPNQPAGIFIGEQAIRKVPALNTEDDKLELWSAPVVIPKDAQGWKYIKAL